MMHMCKLFQLTVTLQWSLLRLGLWVNGEAGQFQKTIWILSLNAGDSDNVQFCTDYSSIPSGYIKL